MLRNYNNLVETLHATSLQVYVYTVPCSLFPVPCSLFPVPSWDQLMS
ncbi:hypothetical protein [Coleofasciculus sp. E1-EBD-02]